jgi:hypothetical protein
VSKLIGILLAELAAPLQDRFIGPDDAMGEQQLFAIAVAEAETEVQPDTRADDLGWKMVVLVTLSR